MDTLLYWLAKTFVTAIQLLPLRLVARLGRCAGRLAWIVDGRHRSVAIDNLKASFGNELPPGKILQIARENFARLGENYLSALKTAAMSDARLQRHFQVPEASQIRGPDGEGRSAVFAVGHFGNFELYPRSAVALPGFQFATTYRALNQPGLNRLLVELRQRSGCWVFERRMAGDAVRAAMKHQKLIMGLFSDQHAGRHGAWLPFFGRLCSTTTAPAVFALRYKMPLFTAICYRTGLAQWRIEVGPEIPTTVDGERRSPETIMSDVNRAFELAIRRDPANWFWVHKRWKPPGAPKGSDLPAVDPASVLS